MAITAQARAKGRSHNEMEMGESLSGDATGFSPPDQGPYFASTL
jgi:hypothetical protein